jgi:hypothetical protein
MPAAYRITTSGPRAPSGRSGFRPSHAMKALRRLPHARSASRRRVCPGCARRGPVTRHAERGATVNTTATPAPSAAPPTAAITPAGILGRRRWSPYMRACRRRAPLTSARASGSSAPSPKLASRRPCDLESRLPTRRSWGARLLSCIHSVRSIPPTSANVLPCAGSRLDAEAGKLWLSDAALQCVSCRHVSSRHAWTRGSLTVSSVAGRVWV